MCAGVHVRAHTHTHIYTDHTHRHGASAGTLEEISKQATNKRRQILRADPFRNNSASVTGVSWLHQKKMAGCILWIYRVCFGWFDMKCSLHGLRIIYDLGMLVEIPNRDRVLLQSSWNRESERHVWWLIGEGVASRLTHPGWMKVRFPIWSEAPNHRGWFFMYSLRHDDLTL